MCMLLSLCSGLLVQAPLATISVAMYKNQFEVLKNYYGLHFAAFFNTLLGYCKLFSKNQFTVAGYPQAILFSLVFNQYLIANSEQVIAANGLAAVMDQIAALQVMGQGLIKFIHNKNKLNINENGYHYK